LNSLRQSKKAAKDNPGGPRRSLERDRSLFLHSGVALCEFFGRQLGAGVAKRRKFADFFRDLLADAFIDREIKPLQAQDDNERFFDHRREWARTDFDNGGLPRPSGKRCWPRPSGARQGRLLRFALPKEYGGKDGGNLWMAVIREHLAAKGLGLFNDLQNEHSVVGNFPFM
jgi:acyl-CoA dehydrogenase